MNYPVIQRMLHELLQRSNSKSTFYVHNLSRFDSRFILGALGGLGSEYRVRVVGKAMNEIFKIRITKGVAKKAVSVTLVDSLKLLPMSLSRLGDSFKCKVNKGVFPYEFARFRTLNYEGKLPEYKYYPNHLKPEQYSELVKEYEGRL